MLIKENNKNYKGTNVKTENNKIRNITNEIGESLKKVFSLNFIFLIGTILLIYKGALLNYSLGISISSKVILYMLFVALFIMSPIINSRKKATYFYINIVYGIITFIIYSNYLYYNYSTNFLSFYQIENIKYAKEIAEGLICIVKLKSIIIFFIDNLLLVVLSIISYKKIENVKPNNKLTILKILFICTFLLINILVVKKDINSIYENKIYNKTLIVEEASIYYYQYEDIKDYISSLCIKKEIDLQRLENIYLENVSTKPEETEYTAIAKNNNVIILQLESLNEYILNKKINGKEITPNLNKFFNDNIYCSNMYNQGTGTTADSEFEMENSMYPLENGYVFQKYYGNDWNDIYTTLKEQGYYTSFMHPNTSTFWNRDAVYNIGYNIDEYNDINVFDGIERAGEFYSDEGFFEKAVEIMGLYEGNFCTTLVSVTTHIAFGLEGVSDLESKLTLTMEDVIDYEDWIFRNYVISCNFVDYAFGKFLEGLEEKSLLDNSILIVYGDHGAGLSYEKDIEKLYNENGCEYSEFDEITKNVHIPFGIKIPNVTNSQIIQRAVSKIDIKPTILDLLGIKDNFSIGQTIFSQKDYSFIKGLGYVTSQYYCFNDKYYNRYTLQEIEENDELKNLLRKMQDEIYLSDTIIKNNLFNKY